MKLRIALLFALPLLAVSETKPDFSGTWKMNPAASKYPNAQAVPAKLSKIVEFQGDYLHYIIERDMKGDGTVTRTDLGCEIGHDDPAENAGVVWDRATLRVRITNANGVRQIERWSLSEDRKRLTDNTTIERPDGTKTELVRIYDRQ